MSTSEPEKKAKARPQSMLAQSFSMDLDSVFGLDGTFELTQTVQDKKLAVNTQTAELEALEARLRAAEERLKAKGHAPKPSISSSKLLDGENTKHAPLATTSQKSTPVSANRPSTTTKAPPTATIRKPATPETDSDEEEDSEEDDESETEESSEESSEEEMQRK